MIEDDRIAAIGSGERRGTVIDAEGLVAVAGLRRHPLPRRLDRAARRRARRCSRPNVRQGITTSVAGNCGISPAPLGEVVPTAARSSGCCSSARSPASSAGAGSSVARVPATRSSGAGCRFNVAIFVGHSTLRATVLGELRAARRRRPSWREMGALLVEGLDDGAVGLSVGLEYFPGRYAGPSEVRGARARSRPRATALVAVHTRGISELFDPAMDEAIGFARASRCRLQLAHVNPMGRANWDAIDGCSRASTTPRAAGLDVGVRHRRLHRVDDDRVRGAAARRRRPRRRRGARAGAPTATAAATCASSSSARGPHGRRGSRAA